MNPTTAQTMTPGLRRGERLGHFEVQQQLAGGGMGIVWRAYDRLLARHVAIKQIADAASVDEIFREKFRREAEVQKRLSHSHPNLVDLYEFVDEPRGLFIVMEYVDGISLERSLSERGGPIDALATLKVVRDVAAGLNAIHAAGIIHRDLKPGNILLANQGPAKVCDFGMATLLAEQDAMEMGTARYMAPELFSDGPVTPAADIYSLGIIAYEMLAGRAAFEEAFKAVLRDQRHQAMRWMKWHTNVRAAAPPLSPLNPAVPQVLAELVERMMAKDPATRIASAGQLLEAINRHFSRSAAAAAPARPAAAPPRAPDRAAAAAAPAANPTAPLPKRNIWPAVLAVVLLVQVAIFGGWFWYEHAKEQRAITVAFNNDVSAFNTALADYRSADPQRLAEARQHLEALADRREDHPVLGVGATAFAMLCQARLDIQRADAAMISEAELDERLTQVADAYATAGRAMTIIDTLNPTTSEADLPNEIEKMRTELAKRRAFIDAAAQIASMVRDGEFDAARGRHQELRRTQGVLIEPEQRVLGELAAFINDQQSRKEIAEIDHQARQLVEDFKLDEAKAVVEAAIARHGSSATLRDRLADVKRRIDRRTALEAAQAAKDRGDLGEVVRQLVIAHDLQPDDLVMQWIRETRSQIAFAEGQRREAAGDMKGAAAKYAEADNHFRHPQAQQKLQELAIADQVSTILAAADSATAAREFEQAAGLYRKALELSPDASIQKKFDDASIEMHLANATDHIERGDVEQAIAELKRAQAVVPNHQRVAEMLSGAEHLAVFNRLIMDGDALREQSQFGAAKRKYQDAINLGRRVGINTREVERRKDDTEFDHVLAQARSALQAELWAQARGWVVTARKQRPQDPRLIELEKELDARAPRTP